MTKFLAEVERLLAALWGTISSLSEEQGGYLEST